MKTLGKQEILQRIRDYKQNLVFKFITHFLTGAALSVFPISLIMASMGLEITFFALAFGIATGCGLMAALLGNRRQRQYAKKQIEKYKNQLLELEKTPEQTPEKVDEHKQETIATKKVVSTPSTKSKGNRRRRGREFVIRDGMGGVAQKVINKNKTKENDEQLEKKMK